MLQERAKELADTIGGDAITLADLNNFHPEDNMILANTTSIGMQPKVEETPIAKVCDHQRCVCVFIIDFYLFYWKHSDLAKPKVGG